MVTGEQLQQAKKFYGPSVDFSQVKIKESRFCSANRPWACGDVVRVPRGKKDTAPAVETADLIHECGHVWQHQHGQMVFLSAVGEQIRALLIKKFDPYNFGSALGVAGLKKLSSIYTESQAQLITEYWRSLQGSESDRYGIKFTDDYKANLYRLVSGAKIGHARPGHKTLGSRIDTAVTKLVNAVLGLFD